MRWGSAALLSFALSVGGARAADGQRERGAIESTTHLASYYGWWLRVLLYLGKLPGDFSITSGASLERLDYWTVDYAGRPTIATGLVAAPDSPQPRAVVVYLHGTTTDRTDVPSAPNVEGKLAAAVFTGGGYLVVAPDYIGLGGSKALHPYLHVRSTVAAVADLLVAATRYCAANDIAWPHDVYVFGFSQGGHAAAAVQRAIEASPDPRFHVRGTATVGGAFDLEHVSVPFALEGHAPSHALYLAYLANAYAAIYRMPLASVLNDRFAARVPQLFDGTKEDEAVVANLPAHPREMFDPRFLADFDAHRPTWLGQALAENEAFDWAPIAPIRLYYGDRDVDVTPDDSRDAAARMVARGGRASAISLGPLDHDASSFQSVALIRAWFDELSRPSEMPR